MKQFDNSIMNQEQKYLVGRKRLYSQRTSYEGSDLEFFDRRRRFQLNQGLFCCSPSCYYDSETPIRSSKTSMRNAIEKHSYDIVQSNLRSNLNDPNEEIPFQTVYMTGLEYSIYTGDWKMAILFFLNSADPAYNCFDGRILDSPFLHYDSISDIEDDRGNVLLHFHQAYLDNKQRSVSPQVKDKIRRHNQIAGFCGLYCLVNPSHQESNLVLSSLWLMKQAHDRDMSRPSSMMQLVQLTRKHIVRIGSGVVWNNHFDKIILTGIMCFQRRFLESIKTVDRNEERLPNDVIMHIIEFVMDDILSNAIAEGLRYTTESVVVGHGDILCCKDKIKGFF